MGEHRDGAGEAAAREAALREAKAERAERFPEVDKAMRAYESAIRERVSIVEKVRSAEMRDSNQETAKGKVLDWATNLIPGVSAVKAGVDALRMGGAFGSFKYSAGPYRPTSFRDAIESMRSYAGLAFAAKETGLDVELKEAEDALREAEGGLEQSLTAITPDEQVVLMEIQQKIFG